MPLKRKMNMIEISRTLSHNLDLENTLQDIEFEINAYRPNVSLAEESISIAIQNKLEFEKQLKTTNPINTIITGKYLSIFYDVNVIFDLIKDNLISSLPHYYLKKSEIFKAINSNVYKNHLICRLDLASSEVILNDYFNGIMDDFDHLYNALKSDTENLSYRVYNWEKSMPTRFKLIKSLNMFTSLIPEDMENETIHKLAYNKFLSTSISIDSIRKEFNNSQSHVNRLSMDLISSSIVNFLGELTGIGKDIIVYYDKLERIDSV